MPSSSDLQCAEFGLSQYFYLIHISTNVCFHTVGRSYFFLKSYFIYVCVCVCVGITRLRQMPHTKIDDYFKSELLGALGSSPKLF